MNSKTKTKTKSANIITYHDYFNSRHKIFHYVKDLKLTLSKYNLNSKGKKVELLQRLDDFYKNIRKYEKYNDQIVKIQQTFRNFQNWNINRYKGIGFYNKKICHNTEDFYTFENIDDIHDDYFFSYKDIDQFIYFFDIRSFKMLIDSNKNSEVLNPYNRRPIPDKVKQMYYKRIDQMNRYNILDTYEKENELTPEQEFNARVLTIFQKMDQLNAAAGGTDPYWFHNLSLVQLKDYYKNLEDIWNYRAQLTLEKQLEIVPNRQMFKIPINYIYTFSYKHKRKLQEIILEEIDSLISSANEETHRSTGCYYVLIALVETSSECAEALPWLMQIN